MPQAGGQEEAGFRGAWRRRGGAGGIGWKCFSEIVGVHSPASCLPACLALLACMLAQFCRRGREKVQRDVGRQSLSRHGSLVSAHGSLCGMTTLHTVINSSR